MTDKKPTMREKLEAIVIDAVHGGRGRLDSQDWADEDEKESLAALRAALDEGEAPKMDHKCEEGVCLICHPIEPNKPPAAAGHCPGCRLKPRCPGIPAAQPAVSEEDIDLLEGLAKAPAALFGPHNQAKVLDLAARLRREGK